MSKNLINAKFDPATITLRDLMELYAKEKKRSVKSFLGSLSPPEFREFMDSPAIEFFESAREDNNPLQRYFDQQAAKGVGPGGANRAFSAVKLLEENVVHQLKRLKRMGDYADDANGFPKLTETVVEPTKGDPRSKKLRINPTKYGELIVGLVEHARQNPKDAPVVRALMAQIYLGFRPKEILEMPMKETIRAADEGSVSKGLFLPAGLAKMDEAVSIPLSPHVESMLNSALESNKSRFGDKDMPDRMFLLDNGKPLPEGSLSRVLKSIKVPGILEDARTGEKYDYLTGSYDLRRGHATFVNMLGFDPIVGAEMKARAIKVQGSGTEGPYISKPLGSFTAQQLGPHIALHNAILEVFARASGVEGAGLNKGIIFDPREDILESSIKANRLADMPTMNVTEMSEVRIPGASLPSNITLPAEPEFDADTPAPAAKKSLSLSQMAEALNSAASSKTVKTGAGMLAGAAGVTALMTDPAEAAVPMAVEMGTEVGTRSALKATLPVAAGSGPLAPAAIAAIIAAETASPSAGAGVQQLNVEEQMQLDVARRAEDIGVEKELMAREPITKIGGSDARAFSFDEDLGQRVTRRTSTDEMTFQSIINKRKQRKAMNEAIETRFP